MALTAGTLYTTWWYVVIHQQPDTEQAISVSRPPGTQVAPKAAEPADDTPQELGGARAADTDAKSSEPEGLQQMGNPELLKDIRAAPAELGPPPEFYIWFWIIAAIFAAVLLYYYATMEAEQFEVLRLLISSVMPLGILTVVVLAVILFGITTATEVRGGRGGGRVPARRPGADARLEAHQGGGVPHRQDHRHGVLAVRRLGAVLGGVRHPGRAGAAWRDGCCRSTCRRSRS